MKNPPLPPIVYLVFTIVLFWGSNQIWAFITQPHQVNLADRQSSGERLLIREIDSSAKRKRSGIKLFAAGDYVGAIKYLGLSGLYDLINPSADPETKIYLENAIAIHKVSDPKKLVKIAVIVPIGSNVNIAQEMLRGVSQVQMDVNSNGGINGMPLEVEIFNDDNDPSIAKSLAGIVVRDPQIIAVIGSNTSNASVAAAPIYQRAGLVMVTPTSMSTELTGIGSYIFRTTPNSQSLASTLAHQILTVDRHHKLAICFDKQAADSVSFKDDLTAEFTRLGGEIANFTCDFSSADFNPDRAIAQAKTNGADALFIAPHVDGLPLAIQVAAANNGSLPLYSSPTLNTFQTLQAGDVFSRLTVVTPWQISLLAQFPPFDPGEGNCIEWAPNFTRSAQSHWGERFISWRTAMSYDAGMAIVTGLRQSNGTRQGLQAALHQPQFSAEGASSGVKFLPTGDRVLQPTIAQVREVDGKWVFKPLQPPTAVSGTSPTENRSVIVPPPQKNLYLEL